MEHKSFTVTEQNPLNKSIIKKLDKIASKGSDRNLVRTQAIALIIAEVPNPTVFMVGSYMNAVTFV